jgi:hypothetical protein
MDSKEQVIAELAYQLWEERGRPHGSAQMDWYEAERRFGTFVPPTDSSVMDSFPASDPPATHRADRPPSNADSKWQAAGVRRKA